MTIYAVTSGSYSDYGIEQVFLTREKALAFIKAREAKYKWGNYRIEVYETYDDSIETADGFLDNVYVTCTVIYDVENGGNWYVEPSCQYISYDDQILFSKINEFYDRHGGKLLRIKVELTVKPQLTDDQIIKIAQDEYAKWKAEKENK